MHLITTIFRFEWRQLIRQRALLYSLLFFIIIALTAIRTGSKAVNNQLIQLDSIKAAYQKDFKEALAKLADTSTTQAKKQAAMAALAEVVNYRLPQNALLPPQPLQVLSSGISDIQPFYQQVQTTVNFMNPPNTPVSNPIKLFSGNFDLAFTWLYLLPLLIIAFCYPVYAQEKESGTAALLTIQGRHIHRIILYKLLFRFLLVSIVALALNATGFMVAAKTQDPGWKHLSLWCLVVQSYILCWFAACYAFISLKLNTPFTALLLMGLWVTVVMILPALSNMYITIRHPVPLRDDLASFQRHEAEEIWGMKPKALADSFNLHHPQYAGSADPAKDTAFLSKRFMAGYYYLLEKRVGKVAGTLEQQLQQRNQYFTRLARWSPVLQTQQLLNELAGTDMNSYRNFKHQVSAFQQQWKTFLYSWQLQDKSLPREAFDRFPVFNMQRPAIQTKDIIGGCMLLYVATLLFTGFGMSRFSSIHKKKLV